MSKIWRNHINVIRKFNLKQRLELKLTAFVVKNLCPNFQNLAPPGKFRVGGPVLTPKKLSDVEYPDIVSSPDGLLLWKSKSYREKYDLQELRDVYTKV